jgi:hypothetical protein
MTMGRLSLVMAKVCLIKETVPMTKASSPITKADISLNLPAAGCWQKFPGKNRPAGKLFMVPLRFYFVVPSEVGERMGRGKV